MQQVTQERFAPIVANGGFMVFDDLLPGDSFRALCEEGLRHRGLATECQRLEHDVSGFRTGNPARWFATAAGGEVQRGIYHDGGLVRKIATLCRRRVRPTGGQGTYSYYDRPGHFLGLHRDINTCDVTMITCLHRAYSAEESGALQIYYKSAARKLSDILEEGHPSIDIHLEPEQSVLLLGGFLPHEVMPAAEGYARSISVLCFEMT